MIVAWVILIPKQNIVFMHMAFPFQFSSYKNYDGRNVTLSSQCEHKKYSVQPKRKPSIKTNMMLYEQIFLHLFPYL